LTCSISESCMTKYRFPKQNKLNWNELNITCQKLNLCVQFCKATAIKKSIIHMGIKLFSYNKLPNKIMEAEKLGSLNDGWYPVYQEVHFTL
jgi:hypothetical protein